MTGGARWWLYGAALATGGAFSILFTGETYGSKADFGNLSVVAIIAGYTALLPLLLAAAVAVLVGSAGRWRFVLILPATVVYTIVAVYGTRFFSDLFSISGWQEIFQTLGADAYEAANIMYADPIPYGLAPGLFLVLVPVVMLLISFATSATLYEKSPIISVAVLGLTIGVLSTVSFEDGAGFFFAVFLICAVGLLLASGGTVGPEGPGRPAVVTGAAVVALVLLVPKLPFSDETISPGMIDWTRIGTGGTSRLDVQADVGDYLTAGRDAELMRVQSSEPLLWRGGTMDYFDGVRWSDTTQPGTEDGEEIAPGVETRPVLQRVQILNARTNIIFGGYKIVKTSEPLGLATENSDGSWSMDRPFKEGDTYEVLSEIPQPTVAQLKGAGTDYPPVVVQKFLQLPDDTPPLVHETAQKIQRRYDPKTPYDEARDIERYLTYDGGFTYNLDVSYRRADKAIEEFLGDSKEGFCTQFSTSMALILRDMGVPSRVVYGATAGEEVGSREYLVRGSNMHTWVEAYFPGVGWYPFNPTPGFSMPTAMEANAPRPDLPLAGQNQPSEQNNLARRRSGRDRVQQTPQEQNPVGQGSSTDRFGANSIPVWPLFVGLPVLLVAAVPISKRALLARGRPVDLYRDLTGRLRDVLPPGKNAVADSSALTPTERMLLLAGAASVEEAPMARFALAYSAHLYSPDGDDAERVASAYRNALQSYKELPRWRRALGTINPASLLVRSKKYVSARRAQLAKTLRARLR